MSCTAVKGNNFLCLSIPYEEDRQTFLEEYSLSKLEIHTLFCGVIIATVPTKNTKKTMTFTFPSKLRDINHEVYSNMDDSSCSIFHSQLDNRLVNFLVFQTLKAYWYLRYIYITALVLKNFILWLQSCLLCHVSPSLNCHYLSNFVTERQSFSVIKYLN